DQAETGLRSVQFRNAEQTVRCLAQTVPLLGGSIQEENEITGIRLEHLADMRELVPDQPVSCVDEACVIADKVFGASERSEQVVPSRVGQVCDDRREFAVLLDASPYLRSR